MSTIQYQIVEDAPLKKCCVANYAFNKDLECVYVDPNRLDYTMSDAWRTMQQEQMFTVITSVVQGLNCREDVSVSDNRLLHSHATAFYVSNKYCVEKMTNGTLVLAKCPLVSEGNDATMLMTSTKSKMRIMSISSVTSISGAVTATSASTTNASLDVSNEEEIVGNRTNGLRTVFFWGTQTYMDTNVAHVVLCIIVVAVYLSVPELSKSIYNRAVLRHNICLLLQGCILTLLGYCELLEYPMPDDFAVFLWIVLQYFTNATGFWLSVICFDMTLSITRFRWTPDSSQRTSEQNRRLLFYGVFVWAGALIPAMVALILEYCPGIPEDFPLKPNYCRYRGGPNVVVNLYFFGIPLLTLFWNNVLFVFTTYKIVYIQRSTEIATRGQSNALRRKYFLFLQLYLLMGAPWFFGSLLACFNNLVILKVCRLIQPILWLLMLAGHRKLRRKFTDKLRCLEKRKESDATNS